MLMIGRDFMFAMHSKMFSVSREELASIHYKAMAYYKLSIFMFNAVPYIALRVIAG